MDTITYTFSSDGSTIERDGAGSALSQPINNGTIEYIWSSDANISIEYYDTVYSIRIKSNTAKFTFVNIPWDFTLKKTSEIIDTVVIYNSTITKTISRIERKR